MNEPTKVITTLTALREAMSKPLTAEFTLDGTPVRLSVNRITSRVAEMHRAILRAPQPPYVKDRNAYDTFNQGYRQAMERAELESNSVVAYHCCPELASGQPGLTDPAAIHKYVSDQLPPHLVELLALTALAGGVSTEVRTRANFTSTPDSES